MHDDDVLIGQLCARIQRRQLWVVPLFDLAEIHPGDRVSIELQSWIAWQVVRPSPSAPATVGMCKIFPGAFARLSSAHWAIGCTEIDRLREDLFLASARTDGLIVESHGRIDFGVFVEPFRVDRIRKRCTCAVYHHLRRCCRAESKRDCEPKKNFAMCRIWSCNEIAAAPIHPVKIFTVTFV